jgi:hypothetical protein
LGERVKVFVCIDAYFSLSGLWFEDMKPGRSLAPAKMRQAREMAKKNLDRQPRVFSSFDEALEANMNNPFFKKSEITARNIVKRHLRPCPGGFTFTHDVRTYGQNQYLHLTEEPLGEFLRSTTAPVLQLLDSARWKTMARGDEAPLRKMADRTKLFRAGCTVIDMSGKGHHLHSDAPQDFCRIAGPWILQHYTDGLASNSSPQSKRASLETTSSLSATSRL